MRKTKMQLVMAIYLVIGILAQAQPFTDAELKWLKMVNDDQAFAEFPGFRQIKEYQNYFGPMVKEYKLSEEEIDFIGRWRIPEGIYQEKKEGYRLQIKDIKIPANSDLIIMFPDRTLLALWGHREFFPLRALIGTWKIENDTLYGRVNRIIAVKLPLKKDEKSYKIFVKPEDFIEKDIKLDWKVMLPEVSTSYDKKLRYLYKPLLQLLSTEEIGMDLKFNEEPIRESAFSQEDFFYSYELIWDYFRLQEYLKGKTKVWEYISNIVGYVY